MRNSCPAAICGPYFRLSTSRGKSHAKKTCSTYEGNHWLGGELSGLTQSVHLSWSEISREAIDQSFAHSVTIVTFVNEVVRQFNAVLLRKHRGASGQERPTYRMLRGLILANELGQRRLPHVAHTHTLANVNVPVAVDVDAFRRLEFFMWAGGQASARAVRQSRRQLLRRSSSKPNGASRDGLAPASRGFQRDRSSRSLNANGVAGYFQPVSSGKSQLGGTITLPAVVKFVIADAEVGDTNLLDGLEPDLGILH